tara:strand:- start:960 stop:1916 length:957 start_codon:yes stop_codon:yes gene_type:complete
MPLPKPNRYESRDEYISRCMSDDTMNEEYPRRTQRLAVCNNIFSNKEQKQFNFSLRKFIRAFKVGYQKLFRQSERVNFRVAKDFYRTGFDNAIDDFLKNGIKDKESYEIFFQKTAIQNMYISIYTTTGLTFYNWYKKNYDTFIGKQEETDNIVEDFFQNYAINSTFTKQTSVQATVIKNIENIFSKFLQDEDFVKDSFEGKSRRLHKQLDKRALWEARRIVKTETTLASNLGVNQGALSVMKPEQMVKKWILGGSVDHREGHVALDREDPIPFEDSFVNPVTGNILPYAGQGPASEVINCSCYVAPIPKRSEYLFNGN